MYSRRVEPVSSSKSNSFPDGFALFAEILVTFELLLSLRVGESVGEFFASMKYLNCLVTKY